MAKKILLVDDDPDLVEAVSTILESKGYAVAKA
jgi:DNA-binding response OmpR family regulator